MNNIKVKKYALVLSGGKGVRLGLDKPKQYIEVNDKPIIGYCLDTFQRHANIDGIVIVIDDSWREYVQSYIREEGIDKFLCFAPAGKSRQHSILSGLKAMKENGISDDSVVIIHDAARPNVSAEIIDTCIEKMEDYDCAMPVIPVKDTVYVSNDGKTIGALLDRDTLFAGQAPESCRLGSYYEANMTLSDEEIEGVRGTSAIAYEKGLTVGLFPGSESNYKITTAADLEKFKRETEG